MKTLTAGIGRQWDQVYSHVNKAVVFIDGTTAELLHWQGGLVRLLHAGATDVKEFSSFESGKETDKKAVFLVSSLLEGVTREILRDILQASHFQYVVVITSQSSAVHTFSRTGQTEDDEEFFSQVEDRLLEWMGNMNFTAECFHIPFSTVGIGNSVFLNPGHSQLFPLLGSDLHQIELQYNNKHDKHEHKDLENLKNVDMSVLPKDLQVSYKCFVSCLDGVLAELGVKEDIFSMGFTSAILAAELEAYPPAKTRRKALSDKASLVLIDRSLDVAAVTSHNTESLLDRIRQTLPRLPGHRIDVNVDMSPLCNVHSTTCSSTVAPGCLATDSCEQAHLTTLITGKHKDALMEVNRRLVEAASRCDLPINLVGRPTKVTAEQLNSTLNVFRGKYKDIAKNLDWLQVAMATSQTLNHPRLCHCDELISVEKGLMQCLADPGGPEALSQVLRMLERKHEEKWTYSLDDVLCMLVYVYSLTGASILEQDELEEDIQKLFLDRVMAEKDALPTLVKSIVGEMVNERSIVSDILDSVWEKLTNLAIAREHLQQFRDVLDPGSAVSPASHNPLLRQLVAAILDPDKPEMADVEYKSSGLRDKLKSGFGLFRGVGKARPSDHPVLVLYIVGGVSCTEVKQIRDVVNQMKPNMQVLIGSTGLSTPHDAVHAVLGQNNVNPLENS